MQFDLAHIWASMGIVSKLIAFTLVLMAVASIAVVVERMIALARSNAETGRFMKVAGPLLDSWDMAELIKAADRHRVSALARLVGGAVRRYVRAENEPDGNLSPVELSRREVGRRREAISMDLRRGMSVLATVGSIAPFVGLLGTVVGIITAFQSIAATGSGGLGAVSAGIAEALIETALGLSVAIPAVLCFNWLTGKISVIEAAIDRSAGELLDEMENHHGRASGERILEEAA
ncbi:MAG: MotA/TolQ/ExbB proton channel family protein [Polyangiaceae bacterium]|nr:MotA/TolQ/ExbB proton channel family protein [Polyangiaceae bacterium]